MNVRIISAYRPCTPAGIESVGRQHERYLHTKDCFTDPRTKMLEDLVEECKVWTEQGDRLILGMDANEDVRVCMENIKDKLSLVDVVLDNNVDKSPPATHNKNNQRIPIDGIWASASLQIHRSSYAPFGEGIPSDH